MSPETSKSGELNARQRLAACILGGLCLGAGMNLMIGNEDFAIDAAGVLLATAGCAGIAAGIIRPEGTDTRQQG